MAHASAPATMDHAASQNHEQHDPPPSDSDQHSHHRGALDHCAGGTSCAGIVLTSDVLVESNDVAHSDRVVQGATVVPASQSPDLEPPPPKA